jgi:hypothetical protein
MAIPAKVVVKPRARVTAGLAKDVEEDFAQDRTEIGSGPFTGWWRENPAIRHRCESQQLTSD